jgi:hypothetical protein
VVAIVIVVAGLVHVPDRWSRPTRGLTSLRSPLPTWLIDRVNFANAFALVDHEPALPPAKAIGHPSSHVLRFSGGSRPQVRIRSHIEAACSRAGSVVTERLA